MKYGRRQGVKFACTTALYLALAEIIADPTTCRAQLRLAKTTVTFESAITQDVDSAQNEIANPTYDNETSSACSGGVFLDKVGISRRFLQIRRKRLVVLLGA